MPAHKAQTTHSVNKIKFKHAAHFGRRGKSFPTPKITESLWDPSKKVVPTCEINKVIRLSSSGQQRGSIDKMKFGMAQPQSAAVPEMNSGKCRRDP